MFNMTVYVIVAVLMTLWGGLLAVLMVWIVYSVIIDILATIFPHRFRRHNRNRCLRKMKQVQAIDRQRAKERFNRRMPPEFSEACHNAIIELIERGPSKAKR